jgi:hypothetical protein
MSIAEDIKKMKFGEISDDVKDLNELYQMRRKLEDEIQYKERLLSTINRAIEIIKDEKADRK